MKTDPFQKNLLPKQALDVYLPEPDRVPTEATIHDTGPMLMLPKYGSHDIIAEQTPYERFFSADKSQEKKTKKFMSERAPLDISGGGGGQLTPLTPRLRHWRGTLAE